MTGGEVHELSIMSYDQGENPLERHDRQTNPPEISTAEALSR